MTDKDPVSAEWSPRTTPHSQPAEPWPLDPVVVLGNGPVGQTAALLLARWGVPCVVLDRRPERDLVGSKAICQQRDAIDIWESVGVGARIAAEGATWTTSRTFFEADELFSVEFADPGRSPLPPFVNISQSRTEQLLDERIAEEPLIEVRWGHQVTSITQDPAGVTLGGLTTAGPFRLRAPYLLTCTGARSDALRESLGVTLDGHSFEDRFLICDIRAELPGWARERRFYFDPAWNPGRQVLIHPCPDSTYRIDWQVPPDYDLEAEMTSGALDRRIRAIVGDTGYELLWQSVYRFHTRCVNRMRVGRVLLAGDAAHLYAPFGARGLNSGVADAENAAWKLAYVGRGWAGPSLLESYHVERHAAARENVEVTTATMDFLVPQSPAAAAHRRDVLTRARDDPAARALVDSGRLAEPYWYTESPLTTVDPRRPFTGRPPRGTVPPPTPGVLLPDLPVSDPARSGVPASSLRRLSRDGLLVLAAPGAGTAEAAAVVVELAPVPVRVAEMAALSGELAGLLGAQRGEWWVVRPDGHLAAVVTELARLYPALCRAVGHTAPATPTVHTAPRHLHHARESGISAGRVADIGSVGRPVY
ncbi:MAG: 3-(3-hydroxy-phenyl)propionate hydroxylase [Pseudonocardiales bacterium]|nr:3-(3-hydroxy-phenyl)propionate hydroxylase [Pseudonocardiales bacterium]